MPREMFYLPSDLPSGFSYPRQYVELRESNPADDVLYPWFFFDPYGEVGRDLLTLCGEDGRKLVPFASLELGDGDTACFECTGSGEPGVVMLIFDGSGRSYGFKHFDAWLAQARKDAL